MPYYPVTHREIDDEGFNALKEDEGFEDHAYQDEGGVWTIAYGHTPARRGQTITRAAGEQLLRIDIREYENGVESAVKVALSDPEFAALVIFAYNVGMPTFWKSTLLKKLNQGSYAAVPAELHKYVYVTVNGRKVVSAGLVHRRAKEAAMFMSGKELATANVDAGPQTFALMSPENVASGTAVVSAVAGAATGGGPLEWALAVAVVAAVAYVLYLLMEKHR